MEIRISEEIIKLEIKTTLSELKLLRDELEGIFLEASLTSEEMSRDFSHLWDFLKKIDSKVY